MTDQHRGDTVGADPRSPTDADGYPLVHTPNIDHFLANGAMFTSAYTPAPICVPARRCLWTGQTPATNGCTAGNTSDPWDFEHTLPGELADAGYETYLAGKSHSMPLQRGTRHRKRFGFHDMDLHIGTSIRGDDYAEWLAEQSGGDYDRRTHGLDANTWDARPSHLPEHQHPTTWTTDRALDFLERRDTSRPFFLTLSYVRPHQPWDPPQPYWDMYIDEDLPSPYLGEWAQERYGPHLPEHPSPTGAYADLSPRLIQRARAGYYGCITQIDHQIHRVLEALSRVHGELDDTVVVFTSDHGEMLGDHHLWRKGFPYEGSARVPLLWRFPSSMDYESNLRVDAPVGLEDLMPTILDLVGEATPDTVEGRSLVPFFAGERPDWRDYYHGELGPIYGDLDATQYLVDEDTKYAWNPVTGEEFLFDLADDPGEEVNLASEDAAAADLEPWRRRLASTLADRPEGFSDGETLATVDRSAWEG